MTVSAELMVRTPETFWFASAGDVSWWADPADGRYDGEEPLRWALMGPVLRASTDALRAGDWTTRDDGTTWLPAADLDGLTWPEQWVIGTMFVDPIDVDPWEDCLTDGRHRTWGAWHAAPDLILPLRSALLLSAALVHDPAYVRPAQRQDYLDGYRRSARAGLSQIPAAVKERSPRYLAALELLAEKSPP